MRFEVKFYETTDGKKPVEDFFIESREQNAG